MIMGGDKKALSNVILSKFGPAKDDKSASSNEKAFNERAKEPDAPDVDEGLMSAAEEVHAAIKSNSPADLAQALKSFFVMCKDDGEEAPEEEDKEESPAFLR